MSGPVVALATSSHPWAAVAGDEDLISAALTERGVRAEVVRWDDPAMEWARFDLVVIRSTWDYPKRLPEFVAWADRVGDRLRNPPAVVHWNTTKDYTADLAATGLAVVPSRIVSSLAAADPLQGWSDVVVKPLVGHSAIGLIRTGDADVARAHIARLEGAAVVQPYQAAIEDGELSIVHFAGAYSHAVLKTPAPGEFRAQHHLGATVAAVEPSPAELELAEAALAAAPGGPYLYSRVDVIDGADGPQVIELELTEPSLYMDLVPPAAGRLAAAIVAEVT